MPSFGTLKADTLTHSTAGSLATNFVVEGSAKCWLHFEGDASSITVENSLNVAGFVDNGTGSYEITFTNALTDQSYATMFAASQARFCKLQDIQTTRYDMNTADTSNSASDTDDCMSVAHGDLA